MRPGKPEMDHLIAPIPVLRSSASHGRHAHSRCPIIIILMMLFGVSGGLLWQVHYNYDANTGSAWDKIHPSSFLILATFLWNAVSFGNPVGYALRAAWLRPGSLLLLLAAVALLYTVSSAQDRAWRAQLTHSLLRRC